MKVMLHVFCQHVRRHIQDGRRAKNPADITRCVLSCSVETPSASLFFSILLLVVQFWTFPKDSLHGMLSVAEELGLEPTSQEDVQASLAATKPSARLYEKQYLDWAAEFGSVM